MFCCHANISTYVNETRDTRDLEQVYGRMITESDDSKVWKSGDCPEALGDSEHASELKPDSNIPTEASDGPIEPSDDNEYYMNKISERLKENRKKTGKLAKEEINTSRIMSNEPTNIFDKLYSTIMEGDDPFAGLDSGMGEDEFGGDELGGDEELDIGGDEVTLNLPRDVAQQLCDMLMSQLGDGEEDGDSEEEMGEDDPFASNDDEMLGDAVVSQPEPKALGGHGDRSHPYAGNTGSGGNKVKSSKTSSPAGGSAHGGNIKEDPDPKPLGGHGDRDHPDAGKVGSGSNRVKNNGKALGD